MLKIKDNLNTEKKQELKNSHWQFGDNKDIYYFERNVCWNMEWDGKNSLSRCSKDCANIWGENRNKDYRLSCQ